MSDFFWFITCIKFLIFSIWFLFRVDEEEEELDINDQDVSRLVIVTQVRSHLCCLSSELSLFDE